MNINSKVIFLFLFKLVVLSKDVIIYNFFYLTKFYLIIMKNYTGN